MSVRTARRIALAGLALTVPSLLLAAVTTLAAAPPPDLDPPVAETRPVRHELHGDVRIDEYGWLRDKEDPAVIAYLEAENAYAKAAMGHTESLQARLYDEMLGRIKQTDLTVPHRDGSYFYYSRTVEGQEYPIYCRKKESLDADEQVLLDVNELAREHEYMRVTSRDVAPGGRFLAYATDTSGYETVSISIKDLDRDRTLQDEVPKAAPWGVTWAADGLTVFYLKTDETKRPNRVYRHRVGSDPAQDELVLREDDPRFSMFLGRTRSDEFIIIGSSSTTTSEIWFIRTSSPGDAPRVIRPREPGVRYSVDHQRPRDGDLGDGLFFIVTDAGDAPNYKLVTAPVSAPDAWTTLIPHSPDVFLRSVIVFREHLVLSERRGGYSALRVHRLADGDEHLVELPESVATVWPGRNEVYDTSVLRFRYTSPVTPASVFDYDMNTRERTLLKRQEVLGGYDAAAYETKRLYAVAPDGERIPISIVHRRGLELDGDNPCLLYGYGSYGASMDPRFSSNNVSLLDRGFVYAVAHVRGGSEMGRRWKEGGRLLDKRHTFTDFIACAEMLIESGYTTPRRLAIRGGSAGGLLIGAVLNLRPDLFAAAHAAVPFVDVVNTMLDPTIPLTTGEYEEWGDPNVDEYYFYIKSYSPYDNVAAQDYPDVLVTAGLNDPRVHYWEPAKWTARLRDRKTDENLLILKTNMGAGHGGASGRYGRLRELAYEYAFIIDRVGSPSAASGPE
ncbi:MAG: S9 family peptidase [Planctomycetota bacterium]|jgi:oligopeptidase B